MRPTSRRHWSQSGPIADRRSEVNAVFRLRPSETTLHNALSHATERHHEYATLEHLLLALIDDEHAAKV